MPNPRTNGYVAAAPKDSKSNMAMQLIWKLFELCYGWLVLMVFVFQMFKINKKFRVMDKNDKQELTAARSRLWNLENQPFGLSHEFCELRDGARLHYMLSRPGKEVQGKTGLVIFLHGFPDSWHIWQPLLKKANLSENATLVALDLPGYGGSDGLASYGPDSVLEAVAEFVIKMRGIYLSEGESSRGPVIIAGHDWGTIIGFRLASEAPALADRFILSNAMHPPLARANVDRRITATIQILRTWLHSPTNIRLLRRVYPNLKPILTQLSRSGYLFTFRLPWPLNSILGSFGDFWFYRLLNAFAGNNNPKEPLSGSYGWDVLASTLGPSMGEIKPTASSNGNIDKRGSALSESLAYPHSVKGRAASGGWATKIRLYQDGLAFQPWTKSLQMVWELNQLEQSTVSLYSGSKGSSGRGRSASRAGLFDMGPPGRILAPVTILWGQKDIAIDDKIALDGMSDYFGARGSHLVCLPKAGHWTTCDKQAVDVWEKVIHWALTGENGTMKELIEDYPAAHLTTTF